MLFLDWEVSEVTDLGPSLREERGHSGGQSFDGTLQPRQHSKREGGSCGWHGARTEGHSK